MIRSVCPPSAMVASTTPEPSGDQAGVWNSAGCSGRPLSITAAPTCRKDTRRPEVRTDPACTVTPVLSGAHPQNSGRPASSVWTGAALPGCQLSSRKPPPPDPAVRKLSWRLSGDQ